MDILLKMKREGNCVALRTYSREAGSHGRFLIAWDKLDVWEHNGEEEFWDTDCGNILRIRYDVSHGTFILDFWWISSGLRGKFTGVSQRMVVDICEFERKCRSHEWQKILCKDVDLPHEYIWTFSARETLRNIAANKKMRRALCKAFARGALRWPDTQITFYADSKRSFYFVTDDGINGGFICHITKREYDGKRQYTYSVHT